MTSPLTPSRLPDLPEQVGSLRDGDLQVTQADRDLFADLCDGGTASDVLAARVGWDAEGLEAGLRLANAATFALGGATKGQEG